MAGTVKLERNVLQRTWSVVKHLVDDVEPDRLSTIAPKRCGAAAASILIQRAR